MNRLVPLLAGMVVNIGSAGASEQFVYFGTGGRSGSRGIYLSRLDLTNGSLTKPDLACEIARPGFLALHPNRRFMYSVCALPKSGKRRVGGVSAFRIDHQTGKLELVNQQPSIGLGPCHLSVDHSGATVLVANYGGGSVAALPINEDGSLREASAFVQHEGSSVNPKRQSAAHAHSIKVDPSNRFAFAPDLGMDKIVIYAFDPGQGALSRHGEVVLAPGSGPRHFAFHPNRQFAYVINELLSTITVFEYDQQKGTLDAKQTVETLPTDFDGRNTTAEIQVHPSGRFVYGSNRGHDTIAVFACDPETGELTFVEHEHIRGRRPRNFGIDPTGTFLLAAGMDSDSVAVFRIDGTTGKLDFTGSRIEVPNPICVKFLQIGQRE